MKIGIAEVLYPNGHKDLDINTMNIISTIADVYYFSYREFLDPMRLNESIKVINLHKQFLFHHFAKIITLFRIINLMIIKRIIKKQQITIDALLLLSFDNTLTKHVSKIFSKIQVYVIHHDDIDKIPEIVASRKKNYYSKIHHIVYEDYIKEGLSKKTHCDNSMVHVVPHPVVFEYGFDRISQCRKVILGIGWSNDEILISKLISMSKRLKEKLPYKIIIRSKYQSYQDDNLEVISGFLAKDKYNNLIKNSTLQLILYPDTFKYRYSATFQTALLQGCYVLVNNVFIGRKLNQMFPNSTYLLPHIEELLSLDKVILNKSPDEKDILSMMEKHSDENISKIFSRIFVENIDTKHDK